MDRLPSDLEWLHTCAHRNNPRDLEGARVAYLRLLVAEQHVTCEELAEAAATFDDGKVPCAWNPDDPIADAAVEIEAARRAYHDSKARPVNVLTRDQWDARPPSRPYVNIGMDDRPGLETHHSVGLYGTDDPAAFARAVQDDHLGRGWTDVFYNLGLWLDGQIIELRPDHAKSGPIEHLTVCFAGNYNNRTLTDGQNRSWHQIRDHLTSRGGGTDVAWHGQRAAVGCPGDNVIGWLEAGHPRPQEPEEEDVNVPPLVKKAGDDKVWVGIGPYRAHLAGAVWKAMEPRDHTRIVTLPADDPFWDLPVLEDGGSGHSHGTVKVAGPPT